MIKPKLKCQPEDFIVEEIATLPLLPRGPYGVYALVKRGWNTVDALREIGKTLRLKPTDLSYGGKKDRYGLTRQWITIRGSKPLSLEARNYHLEFLGFSGQPMGPGFIEGNRFSVIIRKLATEEAQGALNRLPDLERFGVPNYFDDQRFGSYDAEQGFWAEKVLKKQFNGALKAYLTAIHPEDKKEEKERKRAFAAHWRRWADCRALAATAFEKAAFDFLRQKSDGFLSVLFTIPKEDCSMAVSAFQSQLWNETARRFLADGHFSPLASYPGAAGEYWFHLGLAAPDRAALSRLSLPTAASKMVWPNSRAHALFDAILKERDLHPGLFNRFPLRRAFFKSTPRSFLVFPSELRAESGEDELYPGKQKVKLAFSLPRGSYATLIVKRLFAEPQAP